MVEPTTGIAIMPQFFPQQKRPTSFLDQAGAGSFPECYLLARAGCPRPDLAGLPREATSLCRTPKSSQCSDAVVLALPGVCRLARQSLAAQDGFPGRIPTKSEDKVFTVTKGFIRPLQSQCNSAVDYVASANSLAINSNFELPDR